MARFPLTGSLCEPWEVNNATVGPELDRLVLETLTRKRVVGQALCVPVGNIPDEPDYWSIVGGPDGPAQKRAKLRDVFVHVCVCNEPAYGKGPLGDMRAHGHLLECLHAVPLFSAHDALALRAIRSAFNEWEVSFKGRKISVTIYDTKAYAEGDSIALAVCRAVLEGRSSVTWK